MPDPKTLCLQLLQADDETEVEQILSSAGYWEQSDCWRDLGDNENNFSTAGAQQSDPVAALVEKVVNCSDARLIQHCLLAGIHPESNEAPGSVREAVAQFIQNVDPTKQGHGRIEGMLASQRLEQAKQITIAATGTRVSPCFTIVDTGMGQCPNKFAETFMSLNASNKLRTAFVQGKFNMGGTGALRFCGQKRLQLVISRRDPRLAELTEDYSDLWGFTVVRRETPRGNERSSVYRYLAPLKANGSKDGDVLSFAADFIDARPLNNRAYDEKLKHGSLIKLYNYQLKGRSNILMKDGLLRALDVRLPSPCLPCNLHECRDFGGKAAGSFSNPATGLKVRLIDGVRDAKAGKVSNVELEFPINIEFSVEGEDFKVQVFGFKAGKAATYLNKSEGVLFVMNGQTQGILENRFFSRRTVGLDYVRKSLVAIVDCSSISQTAQEELFMNTREALADSDFRRRVEKELEIELKASKPLAEFANRRRREQIENSVNDDKTIEKTLEQLFKKSPNLSALFLKGERLSTAFKNTVETVEDKFVGRTVPSYFRFRGKPYGKVLARTCELGRKCRLQFETDAANDYFDRPREQGRYLLKIEQDNGTEIVAPTKSMSLHNGIANLSFSLPTEADIGAVFSATIEVSDDSTIEPFLNTASVTVVPYRETTPTSRKDKKKKNRNNPGEDNKQKQPSGIELPQPKWVSEKDWAEYEFDQHSAMTVKSIPGEEGYDYYINADNIYLKNELKRSKKDSEILKEQYRVGMTLIGLGVIHDEKERSSAKNGIPLGEKVEMLSSSMALMLIPMINTLSSITDEAAVE